MKPSRLALCIIGLALAACGEVTTTPTDAAIIDAVPTCDPACDTNATCTGTTCSCNAGYDGDGVTCADINECDTANGGCSPNALCTNTNGSRTCACLAGFVGDGLVCAPVWQRVGTFPGVDIEPTNQGSSAAAAGNLIFVAADTGNLGGVFRSFNTTTNQLSGQLAMPVGGGSQNDFCACGYTQTMFSDGNFLYVFGNWGERYNIASNSWSTVTSYSGSIARGEAAGVLVPMINQAVIIGGRGPRNDAINFNLGSQAFAAEPGTLPYAVQYPVAWAMPGNTTVYVAGGDASDGNRRHLVRHQVGTSVWEPMPDAPEDIGFPVGMGHFENRLWVAAGERLQLFNLATSQWDRMVTLPANVKAVVTNADGTFAIAKNGTTLDFWKLQRIE